jgi:nitrogen fixation/metabolism regulation signal transduction histidine kinase
MSIRLRLLIMCFVVALLPAIPLTFLVQNLLEKSFNVGLSSTVSNALESGMAVSRTHMMELQTDFEQQVKAIAAPFKTTMADSGRIADAISKGDVDGFFIASPTDPGGDSTLTVPVNLKAFGGQSAFHTLISSSAVVSRSPHGASATDLSFFETDDKAVQLALWNTSKSAPVLFYEIMDPEFLVHAGEILKGNQIFAQLRLAQDTLSRSFFYPFMLVYGVVLIVALLLALFMAERMSAPVRRLAEASREVAAGNWNVQLERNTGGEIGRLIDSFNAMVSRLDTQQKRLLDMEKIAGWREMARHLAHEIKNPILPIRLAVQEMRDQYHGEDATYRKFIDDSGRIVDDELVHLGGLVKEFSAFAKMPGLKPTRGSLSRLLADVAKLYAQVDTRIDAEATLPEFPFDADQIRRVVVNLFDNAVSVSPEGTRPQVSVVVRRHDDEASMMFTDNGPGIAPEHMARVFDPYFTTRSSGTGLGLALTKSIVVMHEGSIEVESPPAGGAAFTVTLPLGGPQATSTQTLTTEEG